MCQVIDDRQDPAKWELLCLRPTSAALQNCETRDSVYTSGQGSLSWSCSQTGTYRFGCLSWEQEIVEWKASSASTFLCAHGHQSLAQSTLDTVHGLAHRWNPSPKTVKEIWVWWLSQTSYKWSWIAAKMGFLSKWDSWIYLTRLHRSALRSHGWNAKCETHSHACESPLKPRDALGKTSSTLMLWKVNERNLVTSSAGIPAHEFYVEVCHSTTPVAASFYLNSPFTRPDSSWIWQF